MVYPVLTPHENALHFGGYVAKFSGPTAISDCIQIKVGRSPATFPPKRVLASSHPTPRPSCVFAIGQTNRRKLEMKAGLRRFVLDDEGAALLEYGMIVLLIAVLCIVTLRTIGSKVSNGFSSANSMIP